MIDPNVGVRVSMGPLAELPAPTGDGVAVGDFYTDIATFDMYQLKRDQTTGALSWIHVNGGTGSLLFKFSGGYTQLGASVGFVGYTADNASTAGHTSPVGYPAPNAGTLRSLRVTVEAGGNTIVATDTRLELYKNGVATGIFVTVPAGAVGSLQDLVHSIAVVAGDRLDLQMSNSGDPGAGGGELGFSATALIT